MWCNQASMDSKHYLVVGKHSSLRGIAIHEGEEPCQNYVCLPSEKDFTLKNLLVLGANSLLLAETLSEEDKCTKSKWKVTKIVSLVKQQKIYQVYTMP